MNFFTKLTKAIERSHSLLCVGLDPVAANLPEGDNLFSRLLAWASSIITQTSDLVCCYKPNIAFFEQFGPEGLRALVAISERIPEDIPMLLDAKRGDIGSSADAYARGVFGQFHADAVTLSPYLGEDSIKSFLKDPEKAAFVLCQTSNPSAKEIQDHGEPPLFEFIAHQALTWGSSEQVGLVIGATQPEALRRVRQICPETWFLAPGVGAQGGDLAEALQAGLRPDGLGMIIPVSRSILNTPDPRAAAIELRDAINAFRRSFTPQLFVGARERLILKLFDYGCVKFGDFTLASGKESPIYIDLRRVVSFPDLFKLATASYIEVLNELDFDLVAGVPYAALPLAAAAALKLNLPLIYPRKEVKTHGTGQKVEGAFQPGQRVVLMEDVITSGGSILTAAEALRTAGLAVRDAVVMVDRKQGGVEALLGDGIKVTPVLNIFEILDVLKSHALIDDETYQRVKAYLQDS
ncbi:MAG TPA: orotate phosphoribosyltransferase [Anaerolineaceae bacterium]|nr:orotate phosphoribosyltransferase [Anaerolineaceae bacterium]